ncbi:MAG: 50S ribosomal protein L17 [Anaerolineae bacterium]|jgi:large subunit ribosomal protein L17|nr:50S ribosomal protein L17 [Anaerolineae bacterium]PKN89504.1 MAG: 50S ribosomal protein L17 [Chloroflexi bacterium HGW-Chloroflexi-7]PKN97945.1 MAG: 50S ribosomal protein L17 [Chloroflexi bacterium HGW-Chloroflexi-4]PKO03102.1 MAG: 50S ribosomal protein L17 [Chloroflexi bacterium HGW-Chloroflexi-5]HCS39746.1 50S ribosomal protein L17 [Anaerolineaceae bacterium]
MRHNVAGYRLGRTKDQRLGLRRTMINQLFTHEKITTTRAKALFIRGEAEKLITLARRSIKGSDTDKMNARRLAAARLGDATMVKKLFDEIGPRFETRNGGYTRILKLGPRLGDSSDMVLIELVEE